MRENGSPDYIESTKFRSCRCIIVVTIAIATIRKRMCVDRGEYIFFWID